jgi:hypothetical protein
LRFLTPWASAEGVIRNDDAPVDGSGGTGGSGGTDPVDVDDDEEADDD